jgi:hypothetical protein
MKVNQTNINCPIKLIPESILDGVKLGKIEKMLEKENMSYEWTFENEDVSGLKIKPDDLVRLLTMVD